MSFNNNIKYQFLVFADDVNILGESLHTTKENTASSVVASKEGYKQMMIKISI